MLNSEGESLANVMVFASEPSSRERPQQTVSGKDGRFRLEHLHQGRVRLTIALPKGDREFAEKTFELELKQERSDAGNLVL